MLAIIRERRKLRGISASTNPAHPNAGSEQRSRFRAMDPAEKIRGRRLAFALDIGDLTADHSIDSSRCERQLFDQSDLSLGIKPLDADERLNRQREERVPGENRHGL